MKRLLFHALTILIGLLWSGCLDQSKDQQIGLDDEAPVREVRLSVTVPEDASTVYLTGNLPELGPWDPAALAMTGEGPVRVATVSIPPEFEFEYKFTLGSWDREGLSPLGGVMPNFQLLVKEDTSVQHEIAQFKEDPHHYMEDWEGSGIHGRLVYWSDVSSAFLPETRHVGIWLPPAYDTHAEQRFRVLYMHDGQNLFDPRLASTGVDWGVDEAMVRGAAAGLYEPAIVVGAWNTAERFGEYSPWHGAKDYARFLIEELIPRVNAEFRTLTGPEHTSTMGSSMGGLLSYYLVKHHPETFGACGCVSTHFPLSEAVAASIAGGDSTGDATPYILNDIAAGDTVPHGARFFFDYGTKGLDADYGPTHDSVRVWLLDQGLVAGRDFDIRAYAGADHNEASWRARLDDQLEWLLAGPVQ